MVQNQEQPVGKITFSILIALSLSHCLNDLLQSVLSASYPLFKDDLGLSFAQIGLITLVYQLSASVFQPITGIFFDKHPVAWSLPIGMSFTLIGLINLAFSDNLYWILASVFLIGIGSSVLRRALPLRGDSGRGEKRDAGRLHCRRSGHRQGGTGLAGGWGEVTYEAGEMDGTAEEVPICGADRAGGDGTDAAAHRRQQGGQRG